MLKALESANYLFISLAGFVFFLIHGVILSRWLVLVWGLELKIPARTLISYFFIGLFFNLFLPSSTGGDFVKVIGLCKYTTSKAKVVASVVLDRLTGFISMVLIASIAFTFGYKYIQDISLLISIGALACLSLGLLTVLFNEKIFTFMCLVFNRLPKIQKSLHSLHQDIALFKGKKRILLSAVLLACLSQILLALVFFLIAIALHQNIQFFYFLIFVPLICVVSSLPSIGGLGVRDAGAAHLFAKIGVASGIAVSITLINFLFMVLIGLIGGVVYVTQLSPRRLQHHQTHPAVSPEGT